MNIHQYFLALFLLQTFFFGSLFYIISPSLTVDLNQFIEIEKEIDYSGEVMEKDYPSMFNYVAGTSFAYNMSVTERVKYYMNSWYNYSTININETQLTQIMNDNPDIYRWIKLLQSYNNGTHQLWNITKQSTYNDFSHPIYLKSMDELFNISISSISSKHSVNCLHFLAIFDDRFSTTNTSHLPLLVKTRKISDKFGIMYDFNHARHWYYMYNLREKNKENFQDTEWEKKIAKVVWRGNIWTGFERHKMRPSIVSQYAHSHSQNNTYDIAFSSMMKNMIANDVRYKKLFKYQKNDLTITQQLQYKYILSIEGNDVSSGLAWILFSNSVPFMPMPTAETWLMQQTLIAWIHYVPLQYDKVSDEWDLDTKYDFCIRNDEKCQQIAKNGRLFIAQFLNHSKEKIIKQEIKKQYCDFVKFVQ